MQPGEPGTILRQLEKKFQEGNIPEIMRTVDFLKQSDEHAVESLIELLKNGGQSVRWISAMALARIGTDSVDSLIETATSSGESVRDPAIWALAEIKNQKSVEPMLRIMHEESSESCRALTAAALLKIGDPAGINAVFQECERQGEAFRGLVMEAYHGS